MRARIVVENSDPSSVVGFLISWKQLAHKLLSGTMVLYMVIRIEIKG